MATNTLRTIRIGLWIAVFVAAIAATLVFVFIRVRGCVAGPRPAQTRGAVEVHLLVAVTRRGVVDAENVQPIRNQPCFLVALADRGVLHRLPRFQAAGGQLPHGAADGVAILADQDHRSVVGDRDNHHGPWVTDDLGFERMTVRQRDGLDLHRKHAALVHHAHLVWHDR